MLPAVVDKWGGLWSGSGTFQYDGSHYTVMRFDTADVTNPVRMFTVTHEANVRTRHCCTSSLLCAPPTLACSHAALSVSLYKTSVGCLSPSIELYSGSIDKTVGHAACLNVGALCRW